MKKKNKGITIIEILISVAILSGAIAVFSALLEITKLGKTSANYSIAYKLAEEELEAVRALPNSALGLRASSTFLNILHHAGNSRVVATSGAASSPNVLQNNTSTVSLGLAVLPFNTMSDFSLETMVRSPLTSEKSGIIFRARDLDNFYFLYLKDGLLTLEKKVDGTDSVITSSVQAFLPDTWYKIKISTAGNNISVYINDALIGNYSDSSHSYGASALANENNMAEFDNVSLIWGSESRIWRFDDVDLGKLPDDWMRVSPQNLPGGSAVLSIYEPYGTTDLKKIDVGVSWSERGGTKSVFLSTMKAD